MFEECLEFQKAILFCYGEWKTMTLQQGVPMARIWAIAKVITSCLNLIVNEV
jgi:hypothetical protein